MRTVVLSGGGNYGFFPHRWAGALVLPTSVLSGGGNCGLFFHIGGQEHWFCALLFCQEGEIVAFFSTSMGRSTGFAHFCSVRRGKLWPFFLHGWAGALVLRTFVLSGGGNCGIFFHIGGQEHWFCPLLFCQEGEIVAFFSTSVGRIGQEHWFCALLFCQEGEIMAFFSTSVAGALVLAFLFCQERVFFDIGGQEHWFCALLFCQEGEIVASFSTSVGRRGKLWPFFPHRWAGALVLRTFVLSGGGNCGLFFPHRWAGALVLHTFVLSERGNCGLFFHIGGQEHWFCALLFCQEGEIVAFFSTSVGRSTGCAHFCSVRRGKLWPFFLHGWAGALVLRTFVLSGGGNCGIFFHIGGQEHWFCPLLFCQEGEIVAFFSTSVGRIGQEHWFCALLFCQEGEIMAFFSTSVGRSTGFAHFCPVRRGKLWPFFPHRWAGALVLRTFVCQEGEIVAFFSTSVGRITGFAHFCSVRRGKLWPFFPHQWAGAQVLRTVVLSGGGNCGLFSTWVGRSTGFAHFCSVRRGKLWPSCPHRWAGALVLRTFVLSGGGSCGLFSHIGGQEHWFCALLFCQEGEIVAFFSTSVGRSTGFAHFCSVRRALFPHRWAGALVLRTFVLSGGGNCGLFFHMGGQEHWFCALLFCQEGEIVPFFPHRWAGALVLHTFVLSGGGDCGLFFHIGGQEHWFCALLFCQEGEIVAFFPTSVGRSTGFAHFVLSGGGNYGFFPHRWAGALVLPTFVLSGGGNCGLFFHIGGQEHWFCALCSVRRGTLWPFFAHRWAGALVLRTFVLAGGGHLSTSVGRSTGFVYFCFWQEGELWPSCPHRWAGALVLRTFVLSGGGNCGLFFHIGGQEHWFCALLFCQEGEIVAFFFHMGGQEHWFCALLF